MVENALVVKSNFLINAQGKLSSVEQKLYLTAISMISIDDEDFHEYVIPLVDVKKYFNTDPANARRDIEKAINNLMSAKVIFKNEQGDKIFTTLISSARFLKSDVDMILRIDPNLKPYLLQLKSNFTTYRLMNAYKLDSGHSIRIYELLMQYLKIGKRTFELEELKKTLGIEGKYKAFDNFETRVLKVAEQEINEYTDIQISYEKIKKGTKIHAIEFHVKTKEYVRTEQQAFYDKVGTESAPFIREKVGLPKTLNDVQVMELYEIASSMTEGLHHIDRFEYMQMNYGYIQDKKYKSLFAYYKKALQEDFDNARYKMAVKKGLI